MKRRRAHYATVMVALAAGASWFAPGCGAMDAGGPPNDEEKRADAPTAQAQEAAQTCVTIQRGILGTVADTQVASNSDGLHPNQNFGAGLAMIAGNVGPGSRRALLRFDTSVIPEGAHIDSATLTLQARPDSFPVPVNDLSPSDRVNLHRAAAGWTELTATWTSFDDKLEAPVVGFTRGGPGAHTYDVTSLVAGWVGGQPNYGVVLEQGGAHYTNFYTSEDPIAANRPSFSVCYSPSGCVPGTVPCPGPDDQLLTFAGGTMRILAGTSVLVGGAPPEVPVSVTVATITDPALVPPGLPAPPASGSPPSDIEDPAGPPTFPIYQFGPSGSTFDPPLQVVLTVDNALSEPAVWLCDDAGVTCEKRAGLFYLDTSVSPPQRKVYVEIDHFSQLVITNKSPVGIAYHNGPVMKGPLKMYYIWYGTWPANSTTPTILTDLAQTLDSSPYYLINTTYSDTGGTVSGSVAYGGSYSMSSASIGTTLDDTKMSQILTGAIGPGKLPSDPNGVYFVLTSANVKATSGSLAFCGAYPTGYCGIHSAATIGNVSIKYAMVGDASTQCFAGCIHQTTSPNGNAAADGMASIVVHELSEAVTDPVKSGWWDGAGNENGDKCNFNFGQTFMVNGAEANVKLGTRNFLLQQNWNAATGACSFVGKQFSPCANANGAACNDNDACTQADACQAGVCVGGSPTVCQPLDQCHVAGTCSQATGCSNPAKADGTLCDDGNAKTTGDACKSGVCAGALPAGPIAYYRFDELSGTTATDWTGNKKSGTYTGAFTLGASGLTFKSPAIRFKGVADGNMHTTLALPASFGAITWARSTGSTWNQNGWITSARGGNGFIIHPDAGTQNVEFYLGGSSANSNTFIGNVTLSDVTAWHQYAISYDAAAQKASIWLDGAPAGSAGYAAANRTGAATPVTLYYGSDDATWATNRYGDGAIDEAEVFARALTDADVLANYKLFR